MEFIVQFLVLFCACGLAVIAAIAWLPREAAMQERIANLATPAEVTPRRALLERSFGERTLLPMVGVLADWARRLTPQSRRLALQRDLLRAGLRQRRALEALLALKTCSLVAGLLSAWPAFRGGLQHGPLFGALLAVIGFFGPDLWLRSRVRTRQRELVRSLPALLDLLTSCVEAGLGFDSAVSQVLPALGPRDAALREELATYLSDMSLGQGRQEALRDLADRCGVEEIRGLVMAIIQGDQLGQGVALVLRAQAQHLRTRRRQKAQEESMKAPVKMLIPLTLFIFPAMFVVILGPAGLRIMDSFSQTTPGPR